MYSRFSIHPSSIPISKSHYRITFDAVGSLRILIVVSDSVNTFDPILPWTFLSFGTNATKHAWRNKNRTHLHMTARIALNPGIESGFISESCNTKTRLQSKIVRADSFVSDDYSVIGGYTRARVHHSAINKQAINFCGCDGSDRPRRSPQSEGSPTQKSRVRISFDADRVSRIVGIQSHAIHSFTTKAIASL